MRRSLMSVCLPRKISHVVLGLVKSFGVSTLLNEEGSVSPFPVVLENRLPPSRPAKSAAAPSVIPACPNTNILSPLPQNDNRQSSNRQFKSCTNTTTVRSRLVIRQTIIFVHRLAFLSKVVTISTGRGSRDSLFILIGQVAA